MELAIQPPNHYQDLFVERSGLWRTKDFVKAGLSGLFLPVRFVEEMMKHPYETSPALKTYWNAIGRVLRPTSQLADANGIGTVYFANGNDNRQPYTETHENKPSLPNPENPRPQNKLGISRWLLWLGIPVVGIGAAGAFLYINSISTPVQTITAPTTYVARQGETVNSIARKFGIPGAVIMADNSLQSDSIQTGKELTVNPVTSSRRIPKELGSKLYRPFSPDDYVGAFVTDISSIGRWGSLETVVVFSETRQTDVSINEITSNGETVKTFPAKMGSPTIFVLDSRGRIHAKKSINEPLGKDTDVYPAPDGLLLTTSYPKQDFPWLSDDLKGVIGIGISKKGNEIHFNNLDDYRLQGRYLRIEERNGQFNFLVTSWVSDGGVNPDVSYRQPRIALASDIPFSITRAVPTFGGLRHETTKDDVKAELARLFSRETLSREDLAAIAMVATRNEQYRQQQIKEFEKARGNLPFRLVMLGKQRALIDKKTGEILKQPPDLYDIMVEDLEKELNGKLTGTDLNQSTLNEAVNLAERINGRRPELYTIVANAMLHQRNSAVESRPHNEIASMLNVDEQTGFEVLSLLAQDMSAFNSATGEWEPLEFELYRNEGRLVGIPYVDRVMVNLTMTGDVRLIYSSEGGEQARGKVEVEMATSMQDAIKGRNPTYQLKGEFNETMSTRFGNIAEANRQGNVDWAVQEAYGLLHEMGFSPAVEIEERIREVRTTARVVEILYRGGTARDLVNALSGDSEEKGEELETVARFLYFVGPMLRGKVPTYSNEPEIRSPEEIRIPSVGDVLGEACVQLSICK